MASYLRSAFMLACVTSVSAYGYRVSKLHEASTAPGAIRLRASVSPGAPERVELSVPEQPAGAVPIQRAGRIIGWVELPEGRSVNDLTNAPLFTLSAKPAMKAYRSPAAGSVSIAARPATPATNKYNADRPATNHRALPTSMDSTRSSRYVTNATARSRSSNAFSRQLDRSPFRSAFSRELSSTRSRFN